MGQWLPQNSGTYDLLKSVCFPAADTGFVVGNYGTILKTTDGGSHWLPKNSETECDLKSAFFIDTDTGYAVGFGFGCSKIIKTIDGGENWIPLEPDTIPYWHYKFFSVHFVDANTGYAVGSDYSDFNDYGAILKTSDAGETWTRKYTGTNKYFYIYSVFFTDLLNGYAVGNYSNPNYSSIIFKTTNGGETWTSQSSGSTGSLFSIYFTDSNTGYIGGYPGLMLKTTDKGETWINQNIGASNGTYSLYFPNANTGYGTGYNNSIMKTTDGGINWTSQPSGVTEYLTSVCFTDVNTGYAVGKMGTILKTTNGGGWGAGTEESYLKSKLIKIYPNPTFTHITIETPVQSQLSILNLNGKEVMKQTITKPKTLVDISTLPNGVYFVRVTEKRAVKVGKFVKQ